MLIQILNDITEKNEFESNFFELIFKKAKNKYDAGNNPYIQISSNICEIEQNAFYKYSDLKAIVIPKSIKKIHSEAFGYTYIKHLTIPDSVYFIGNGILKFCINLKTILIKTKLLNNIPLGAFFNCSLLESITIPEGVMSISKNAFVCCYKLRCVIFPTSLKFIYNYAFFRCFALKKIIFPKNIENIQLYGSQIFTECENLDEETKLKFYQNPL